MRRQRRSASSSRRDPGVPCSSTTLSARIKRCRNFDSTTVASVLVPQYLQSVPAKDGWKQDFHYFLETTNVLQPQVMAIGSGGRDSTFAGGSYTVAGFDPTDYDQDIVWADGFFVRWPQKTN